MEPKLLLILALVAGTYAVPTIRESCSKTCTETNKFGYQPGTTYEFDYEVDTTTLLQGASEGLAGLKMSAKVKLEVLSKCDLVLQIEGVSLHERDPNAPRNLLLSVANTEFRQALEEHPLRFSFQDGRVDSLCPSDGERTWVLNIKKGILSMVQNTMDDLTADQRVKETDVAGTCDADYTVEKNGWYSVTIKKNKNLLGCTERHSVNTAIQGTPYSVPSEIQSLPIMKSSHECQQEISKSGILKNSACTENHIFRPFSRDSSGAITKSKQTLTYVRESNGVSTLPKTVNMKTNMIFEHTYDPARAEATRKQVEEKLSAICASTKYDVRPETPRLFADLVASLKAADATTMERVYETIKRGSLCSDNNDKVKKFFLDAIPMVGTSSSVRMLVKFINDNEVTGATADMWMTTLSFIQRPTKEMLVELKPLVTKNGKSMLAITSLLHNYCLTSSCENDMDVNDIVSALENKIGYGCYVDDNNVENVVLTLRALGNAGFISSALPTINSCLTRTENPMEIRVAAAQAFRRASCNIDRDEVNKVFKNIDEDSELRIEAYLALMKCPTDNVLNTVRSALEQEEVNQVGSFIWSHLTNLMETSNPLKQNIRGILENDALKKEFDMDKRKFSRNYEWSFFLEKLNTGASVESNMIWSSKSFIPRSLMANLTVDLFGQSINLVEVGGRIEGLEYFLETYFGPNGYFAEKTVKEATKQVVKGIDARKTNKIEKQFSSDMEKLKGALYMRMFGNDIRYSSFRGTQDLFGGNNFNILDLLISLSKEQEHSFTQNIMFLDTGLIIPTAAGFPINLTLNGTATVDMKASGKIDLRKLGTSPKSLIISGLVRPSAAIEISSVMSVDAFVTKSGLKMLSTLHSSTQLKGHISLKDGQVFSAEWEPSDKSEILSVKSTFFTVHHDMEREQKMITDNRQTKEICSGQKLAKITGLELCGTVQFPNASLKADAPYFPFTGPVSAEIAMYKRDSFKLYLLESNLINNRDETNLRMYFNTPGSAVNRELSTNLILRKKENTLKMNLVSPWKEASFFGELIQDRDLKKVSGVLTVDKVKEYRAVAEFDRSRKGSSYSYKPSVVISAPSMKPVSLTGIIEMRPSQFLETEMTLSGVTKSPLVAKLSMINKKVIASVKASLSMEKKKEYIFETRVQTYNTKKAVKYRPFLSIRSPSKEYVAFGGSVEYKPKKAFVVDFTLDQVASKPMKFLVRVKDASTKKSSRYQTKIDIRTPVFTTKSQTSFAKRGTKAVIMRSNINYIIPRVVRDTMRLNGKINFATTKSMKAVKGHVAVDFKKASYLNGNAKFNLQHNKKRSEGEVDFRYGDNLKDASKRIYLQTIVNRIRISKLKKTSYDLVSKAIAPVLGVDFQVQGEYTQLPNSLESSISVGAGKKNSYSTSISLKDKSKKLENFIGEARLSYPGRDIVLTNEFVQMNAKKVVNKFAAQLEKGQSLTTEMVYRLVSKDEYEVSATVALPKTKPFTLTGQYRLNLNNFYAKSQLKSGVDIYGLSASSKFKYGSLLDVSTELRYPSRRITAELEARNKKPLYLSRLEVNWDADRGVLQRYLVKGQLTYDGVDNIAAELSKTCPKGTVKMSLKHSGGNQYISHADIEWGEKQQVSVDTTFQNSNGLTSGTLKMKTPFENFRSIAMDVNHNSHKTESVSSVNIEWKPIPQISGILTVKKPISWRNLEANIAMRTPIGGMEKSSFHIKHDMNGKLQSSVKSTWNKDMVQLDLVGTDSGRNAKDLAGRLSLKSTINGLESVFVAVKHSENGNRFENAATLDINGESYTYQGEVTHYRAGWQLQNSGNLLLSSPSSKFESSWSHRNAGSDLRSSMKSDLDGKVVEYNINAKENMGIEKGTLSLSVSLKTPFSILKNADFNLSHEHRPGVLDTTLRMNRDGRPVFSLNNNYLRRNDQATSSFETITMGKSFTLKSSANYASSPYIGKVELITNGKSQGLVEGRIDWPSNLLDGSLQIKTNTDLLSDIHLTVNQNRERNELVTRTALQYQPGKSIVLEKRYQWERKKSLALVMTTPFSSLQRLTMGAEVTGDLNSFHSAANFQIQPILGPLSATAQWSNYGGYLANIRIDTPFENFKSSRVSLKSEVKGEDRESDLTIEYLPSRFIKVESSLRPKLDDLDGFIRVKSHSKSLPYLGAAIRHNGNINAFVTHAELEYAVGKKIEGDVSFSSQGKIDGSLTLKTPFSDDISAMVSHKGHALDFITSGFLQYKPSQRIEVKSEFKRAGRTEGSISVKSPFFRDISGKVNYGSSDNKTTGLIEGKLGTKKYECSLEYENKDKLRVSTSVRSPHFDDLSMIIEHTGVLPDIKSHFEARYGRQEKYEGDIVYSFKDNLLSSLSVKSPYHSDISVLVRHAGSLRQFSSHAEAQYGNNDKYEGDVVFINGRKLEGSLVLKCPGRKDMSAAFSHEGSLKKFKTSGSVNLAPKAKYNVDITFANAKRTLGTFNLKSPVLPNIAAQLKHSGDLRDMNTAFEVNVDKVKKLGIQFGVSSRKRLISTLKIISPLLEDIDVKLVHKGKSTNFKISTDVSVGKSKYATDIAFKARPNVKVTVSTLTPLKGLRKIKADLSHSGSLKSFKSQASFGIGKEKYTSSLKFTVKPNLIADIAIETPLKGMKKIGAVVSHEGSWSNFKCHGEITRGKTKEVNGDVLFSASPLSAYASLQTPFKRFENSEVTFTHEGSLKKFETKAKIVGLRGKTLSASTKVDTEKDITAEVSLQTPFNGLELLSGSLSHTGSLKDFTTHAEMNNGSPAKYVADIRLTLNGKIDGEMVLKTPLVGRELLRAALSHDGTINNFRSHVEVQCTKDKSEADLTFSSFDKVEGNLVIKSPYIKTISTSVSAKANPYSGRISATYGNRNLIKGVASLSTSKDIKGSASLNTWFAEELRATLSHEGTLKQFRTQAEMAYGKQSIQLDTNVDTRTDITASTTVRTPFSGLELSSASLSVSGTRSSFRSHAECSISGKTVETDVIFTSQGPMSGTLALRTPLTEIRDMVASFRHTGPLSDFTTHAEFLRNGKKTEVDLIFDIDGDMNIKGTFKHPTVQDVLFLMEYSGQLREFKSHAELNYRGQKQINTDVSLTTSPTIEISGKLEANCPVVKSVELRISHKGERRNFKTEAVFNWNGKTTSGDLTVDSRNGMEGRAVLKTPISRDVVLSMIHRGDISSFSSEGNVEFSGRKQYHAEATFDSLSNIDAKLLLKTPKSLYSAGVNHDGNMDSFKLTSFLVYDVIKRIQINVNFDNSDKITGLLSASTPFMSNLQVDFSHESNHNRFRSQASVRYDDKESFGGEISLTSKPDIQGNAILRGMSSKAEMTLLHTGSLPTIDSSFKTLVNDEPLLALNIQTSSNNGYTGKVILETASEDWRRTTVSYKHKLTSFSLEHNMELAYGEKNKIEYDIDASFYSPYKGSLTLKTPFELMKETKVSYLVEVLPSGFQSHSELSILEQTVSADVSFDSQTPMKASFILTSSIKGLENIKASLSHERLSTGVVSHAEATFQKKTISADLRFEARDIIEGSIQVQTPFRNLESQSIILRHSQTESHAEVSIFGQKLVADLERSERRVRVALNTPFIGYENQEVLYTRDGSKHHIEIVARGEKMESDLDMSRTGISLRARTPFKDFEMQGISYNFDGSVGHAEGTLQGKKIEADLTVSPTTIDLIVKTPFEGYKSQRISINHDLTATSCNCKVQSHFNGKQIEGSMILSWADKIDGTFSLLTPFQEFEKQYVTFSYEKSFETHTGRFEGMLKGQKIEFDISVALDDEKNIRVNLKTPFDGFEEQNAVFTQKLSQDNLKSHAEITFNGEKYEVDASADYGVQNQGSIVIKTPISGYEETKATAFYASTPSELRGRTELVYNRRLSAVDIRLTSGNTAEGSLSVTTPFKGYQNLKLSFNNKISKNAIATHAAFEYGNGDKVEADIEGSIRGKVDGRISLKTPFESMKLTELTLSHEQSASGLQSHTELIYGKSERISLDAVVSLKDFSLDGNIVFKSPLTKDARASVSSTWSSTVSHHSEIVYGSDKIEGDFSFDNTNVMTITAFVKTPYKGLESTSFTFNKQGDLGRLDVKSELSYGGAQKIAATLRNHIHSSRMESSISVSNPYTEDMKIRYEMTRGFDSFTHELEAAIGSNNNIRHQLSLQRNVATVDFQSTLTLTVNGESQIFVTSLNHQGTLDNFNSELRMDYNNEPSVVKISVQTGRDIAASLSIETPLECMRNIQSSLSYSGDISQFTSNADLKFNDVDKIEAKLDFFVYKLRRLNTVLEVKTPFSGYEATTLSLKHNSNSNGLRSFAEAKYGNGKVVRASIKALADPKELELSLVSPFRGYETMSMKAKHSITGHKYETNLLLSKMQDEIVFTNMIDLDSVPLMVATKLTTPISGFESSEIIISTNKDLNDLESRFQLTSSSISPIKADLHIRFTSISQMDGVATFTSGLKHIENLKFVINNRNSGDEVTSHIESSWTGKDSITFDGSFGLSETWNGKSGHGGITLLTPFSQLRSFVAKSSIETTGSTYKTSMDTIMNGEKLTDMDAFVSYEDKYALAINVREPKQYKIEAEVNTVPPQKTGFVMINWDTKRDDSQVRVQGDYTKESDKQVLMLKASSPDKSMGIRSSLENTGLKTINTLDILSDDQSIFGYDVEGTREQSRNTFLFGNKLKLRLPTRNYEISGSYNDRYGAKSAEGTFAWDADRDNSKKIGFKTNITPRGEATSAAVSFEIPSIGQDVKLDSEMMINSGNVIFDGKTELKYSRDDRKTLVIKSRLEDVSYGYNKNYTLTFGLQHSYTNVDVQVASHVGRSEGRYTTGVDVKYLTAKRQTKNFALMAEIDSLKKQMSMDMKSPMKSIQMTGNIKTTSPYKLSLRNLYDNTKPINTEITLDTDRKSIDLQLNYDISNPNNVLHMSAKYVNDSAVLAELFREENSRRIVDSLLAIRLNTSRLLHTRLHWRPTMLQEIKDAGLRRIRGSSVRMSSAFTEAAKAVSDELNAKYNVIRESASQDFTPYANFLQQIITELQNEITTINSFVDNEHVDRVLRKISDCFSSTGAKIEDLKTFVRRDFPYKDRFDLYVEATNEIMKMIEEKSTSNYGKLIDFIGVQLKGLSDTVKTLHDRYQGMVSKLSQNDVTDYLNTKYEMLRSKVVDTKLPEKVQNIADQYTNAIYNVRDQISSKLQGTVFQGLTGLSSDAYQMASSAYKFWEVEENINAILDKIYKMAREEIKEEIDSIKFAITNLQNSKFTVYDPINGEIQMDSYLPVALPSLKSLPSISLNKPISKIGSYMPDLKRLPSLSDMMPDPDVRNWIPPYKGVARLMGSHVNTFDGKEFDFSGGKCSYVLTKDYLDGNFSIIAKYVGKGQKTIIVQTATQTVQVAPNGKLRVDGKPIKPFFQSDEVTISQTDDVITISGNGFRADVDVPRDVISVQVSGWYHNRLGGLFGTLNNERYDDMATPSRKITDDVSYLINTWDVDSKCR